LASIQGLSTHFTGVVDTHQSTGMLALGIRQLSFCVIFRWRGSIPRQGVSTARDFSKRGVERRDQSVKAGELSLHGLDTCG
jgi:hypothetical protein